MIVSFTAVSLRLAPRRGSVTTSETSFIQVRDRASRTGFVAMYSRLNIQDWPCLCTYEHMQRTL